MAKFIIRRLLLMLLTMLIVSVAVFVITEAAPGNVARNVLGIHITPEQEASFLAQNGLDKPLHERYLAWLIGSDWRASNVLDMPLKKITTEDGFTEWWAVSQDGTLLQWQLEGEDLLVRRRQPDGSVEEEIDNESWQVKDPEAEIQRLEDYRAELMENDQLSEQDKQAILEQLDRILEILRENQGDEAALEAALEQPESALESMIDPEVANTQDAFVQAALNVGKKDRFVQALDAYETLSSTPAEEISSDEMQAMARQLDKAAEEAQKVDPGLADQLRQAVESLQASDPVAAQETLAGVADRLDYLIGSLHLFVAGLQEEEYRQAVQVLTDLADPDQTPFDADQLAILPDTLDTIAKELKTANADLNDQLSQAVDSLEEGDTEAARNALTQAADTLQSTVRTIVRSNAAAGARVIRTFWGIDTQNHAVRWEKGAGQESWIFIVGKGWQTVAGKPAEYIPLQKGLLRGDPGVSLRTGRPVADLLFIRLRNSLVLAGIAFVIVMPLALVLGVLAGLNEGNWMDRVLSIGGMMFSVTPEFATGIFLILIFAFWLGWVPGATVFGEKAPWSRPDMLVLPVLTLTLIELGYVLRITRASMVEVMKAPYIRTAFLKGLPYRRVVLKHAVRNALMAPITVIMLHVNWLLGGIVVVEVIFGYPGLGSYLLESALFKDFTAIEAGAIILVAVAVGTQLLADILYTFLNPRIRYA
jgi:peptide/nickel transport system permease protein